MVKKFLVLMVLMVFILVIATIGCRGVDKEVLSFADRATEDYLTALNNQDYESYKKDLDDAMLDAFPEEEFIRLSSYLKDTIGEYVPGSREYFTSSIQEGKNIVIYRTDYTQETKKVVVTMVISKSDEGIYKISGSWFNSSKLRETKYE